MTARGNANRPAEQKKCAMMTVLYIRRSMPSFTLSATLVHTKSLALKWLHMSEEPGPWKKENDYEKTH